MATERTPVPTGTERTTADVLFGDPAIALRPTFSERAADLEVVAGLTASERATFEGEALDLVRESGVDAYGLGSVLVHAAVDAHVADVRGRDDEAALDAQIQTWNERTRETLRGRYGPAETEALLERADAFVRQHPKLHALLGTRGLGSRPDIVTAIVEHVRRHVPAGGRS